MSGSVSGGNEPVTTGNRTVTSNPRQLSDGNGLGTGPGTVMGQGPTDKIAFYSTSGPGVVQPAGSQVAVTRGQAAGSVMTFSSAQSPSGVTTLTSAEYSITVQNGTSGTLTPATGDVMIVNKPTSQAGLGVGNIRQSAAGVVGLSFFNLTATMITPTASQAYGVVGLRGLDTVTAVLTPAAVVANTTAEQQFAVPGIRAGEAVIVNKPTTNVGLDVVGVRAVTNNVVGITFINVTAGTLTPTAGQTYSFFSTGGVDANTNQINLALNSTLTPATITGVQAANITISSSNINADDTILGWQKPTTQVSVIPAGGYVASAGVVHLVAATAGTTVATPTASEIYQVGIYRNNPTAPCVVYTVTLTPAVVAANTCAEQTFAVTGVVSGSAVTVNLQSPQPGIGIAGTRVSSAGNVAINFCNATATAITPAAAQYIVANWQGLIDVTTGNAMVQSAYPAGNADSRLVNAIRAALAAGQLGLIAGT